MIDLNKIRSLKTLETMKKHLVEFLAFDRAVMVEVYNEDFNWGEEDYEADKDSATYFLEQVEKRIKSLSRYHAKVKATRAGKDVEHSEVKVD